MTIRPTIRMAVRDWEFLTPLLLGDISSQRIDLVIDRVDGANLPHAGESKVFDVAEASFSRYAQARAAGDTSLTGIPNFILRGFRHRCVITRSDSSLEGLGQLKGKKIGLTGWPDSGNTWTRAAARRQGVQVGDALWFVGRLTAEDPTSDRLGRFAAPGLIEAAPEDRPLMDLLAAGWLDAVLTPFMPSGFFATPPRFRQVDRDFRTSEKAYFREVGYVPGIHLLTIKTALVERFPWLPQEVSDLIDASRNLWQQKRERFADGTPWMIDDLIKTSRDLPSKWGRSGLASNEKMIVDFTRELHEQGITYNRITISELFPEE